MSSDLKLHKTILYFFIIASSFHLYHCSNPKPLTGGKKDEKAPEIIKTFPLSNSTRFHGNKIIFVFDEYIRDNGIAQRIIITPTLDSTFKTKLLKNQLELTFHKQLKPETTYSINLTECIKDVTEGNITKNASLCFSTGSVIDSLYITGIVSDLYTGVPIKEAVVGLYNAHDTITLSNGKALYIARSDEKGNYRIANIRKGKYILYALQDGNSNLKFDNKEKAGFKSDTIVIEKKTAPLNLVVQRYDVRDATITSKSYLEEKDIYHIEFSKGLKNIHLESKDTIYYSIASSRSSLDIYEMKKDDSVRVRLIGVDSFNLPMDKTMNLFFPSVKEKDEKRKIKKKEPFIVSMIKEPLLISDSIIFSFQKPIKTTQLNLVYFKKDSTEKIYLNEKDIFWNETKTTLTIKKTWPSVSDLTCIIKKGGFISVKKDSCDSTGFSIRFKKIEDYGSISGEVKSKEKNYTIELLKENGQVYRALKNIEKFKFELIEVGNYTLRVLIDPNKNGQWDIGSITNLVEPESIIVYDKKIEVKANWDVEDLIFNVDK